ncbi:MAG: hypothetical protein V9H26_18910 [Verrucomicrobiota bacterium]|nr:hypothetical protein [Verrucomicrobiota bacterium]MCC6821004.1 hypothetical protein [Limisphaerales bacterium]
MNKKFITKFRFKAKPGRIVSFIGLLLSTVVILVLVSCSKKVAHQRPYRWDAFGLPEQHFTNATIIEVVTTVNGAVAKASNGSVTQAVFLDRTPADIIAYPSDPALKTDMDKLIADFRKEETNWMNRGACGFETFRHTGTFMAGHSLGCEFQQLVSWAELNYSEKPDAIHLGRNPAHLECRSYKIGSGLKQMAEDLKRQNQVRVDTDPVTSAFIDVAKVYLWSIDVPTGTNEMTGEFRYTSVFKYLPEKSVLLVIESPEAHETAMKNLKENGFWENL